eukprot:6319454-Amphidinium_carterae.1
MDQLLRMQRLAICRTLKADLMIPLSSNVSTKMSHIVELPAPMARAMELLAPASRRLRRRKDNILVLSPLKICFH